MVDILTELNLAQRAAVEAINGPVLIVAGPGSGKTRVIAHRVAYLVKVCGMSPHRIMAVTFTNKSAREMEERLHRLVSGSVNDLTLGTFHAISAGILRREGKVIGIDSRFVIYDDEDQISLLKRCMQGIGIDPKKYAPRAISSAISAAKSHLITPQDYSGKSNSYFEEVVTRIYERYQQMLGESNALDFDDLLMKTVQLFKGKSDVLGKYQSRYLHIMVDEFQDTNLVQYEMIKQLGGKYNNICVVGDPDQSIYSWRFADLRNIMSFEKDYPDAKVIWLEQNYRSTKRILETASCVISANQQRKPKELWTENATGELTVSVETYTEQEEAQFVVNEVERLVTQGEVNRGGCAVMYRTNAQSRVIEEAFVRYGTPYKLIAGTRFYERREVKDIIAYLRIIHNPYDTVSLLRIINVPQRGIGQRTITELSNWARSAQVTEYKALQLMAQEGAQPPFNARAIKALTDFLNLIAEFIANWQRLSVVALIDALLDKTGYRDYIFNQPDGEDRWENILELRTVAQQYEGFEPVDGLSAFLEEISLVSDVDRFDESVDAVTLITLHQSKGLEFPIVFIVGVEEGILPHIRSFDDPSQMEEERRLCYVGITRAKRRVYLVRAFKRSLMGRSGTSDPSRFLRDIPSHLISGDDSWRGEKKQITESIYSWNKASAQVAVVSPGPELKDGDHVHHPQFGDGVIVSSKSVRDDYEVMVAFHGAGVKKLLRSLARLEKV